MEIITEIGNDIWNGLLLPIFYFADPTKRVNIIYLLSSLLFAFYIYKKTKTNLPFYRYIFHEKIWWSKSAFVDYKYFFFNGIIKVLLFVPIVNAWRYISVDTNDFLEEHFEISTITLSQNEVLIYYSISVVILYDLVFYILHWTMHKIPFLWEFHKIHHSATSLNPITQYRLHPVELILNNIAYLIVSSVLVGVFDYYSQHSISLIIYAQVNIFSMLFLFWGANLRHSHVKLGYFSFLEKVLISPLQHQIHHSDNPVHFNKNMGAKLAIWDWLFGTLMRSKKITKLHFGLGKEESKYYNTFISSLITPFKNICFSTLKRWKKKN